MMLLSVVFQLDWLDNLWPIESFYDVKNIKKDKILNIIEILQTLYLAEASSFSSKIEVIY